MAGIYQVATKNCQDFVNDTSIALFGMSRPRSLPQLDSHLRAVRGKKSLFPDAFGSVPTLLHLSTLTCFFAIPLSQMWSYVLGSWTHNQTLWECGSRLSLLVFAVVLAGVNAKGEWRWEKETCQRRYAAKWSIEWSTTRPICVVCAWLTIIPLFGGIRRELLNFHFLQQTTLLFRRKIPLFRLLTASLANLT